MGRGGGVITKYSRRQVHDVVSFINIYKTHACTVMIEVHADMYNRVQGAECST